ncbi:MoaD family protein [Desulfurococcus mucosus DSM 2162]|uniref:MoaD family protein n=1 Tax=Desulfurococcus mucosus (strain ATCC 35584 / DSM 2162 / JCM 9187 / O7/1) TaxID=765177 RepID=E8R9Q8_DESM0|nr:MoaD family protein [Desulfurococcus mucosus DSM 2162]
MRGRKIVRVRVKYMLWLESKTGLREEVVEVGDNCRLRDLVKMLGERHTALSRLIGELLHGESGIIVLHNSRTPEEGMDTPLRDMDEVVLMPPVSGG